ncbi:hypothetical protein WA158_004139 [Blastocystis sp. Blastoise]
MRKSILLWIPLAIFILIVNQWYLIKNFSPVVDLFSRFTYKNLRNLNTATSILRRDNFITEDRIVGDVSVNTDKNNEHGDGHGEILGAIDKEPSSEIKGSTERSDFDSRNDREEILGTVDKESSNGMRKNSEKPRLDNRNVRNNKSTKNNYRETVNRPLVARQHHNSLQNSGANKMNKISIKKGIRKHTNQYKKEYNSRNVKYGISTFSDSTIEDIDQYVKDDELLLVFATRSYYEVLMIFVESSLKPFNIENYLVISGDQQLHDKLLSHHTHSIVSPYLLRNDTNAVYGSSNLIHIMENRIKTIIMFLEEGYNVLMSDLDILYFDNPFLYINRTYEASMSIEEDLPFRSVNGGFFYLRSTSSTIRLMFQVLYNMKQDDVDDQLALNMALKNFVQKKRITWQPLDLWRFQDGRTFFFTNRYIFDAHKCKTCIIAHNNWIIGNDAKIYRMKELGIYAYHAEDYYRTENKRFITYIMEPNKFNFEHQYSILIFMTYLSQMLNRVLILPKFIILDKPQRREEQKMKYGLEYMFHNCSYVNKVHKKYVNEWQFTKRIKPFTHAPGDSIPGYKFLTKYLHNALAKFYKPQYLYGTLNEIICIKQYNKLMKDMYKEHTFVLNSHVSSSFQNTYTEQPYINFLNEYGSIHSMPQLIGQLSKLPNQIIKLKNIDIQSEWINSIDIQYKTNIIENHDYQKSC